MKEIPDFDIELAQATDYILRCPLANKAFSCPPFQNFANIVTDTIRWIDQLADNCHMPEFTNHALPHICSIVKRASEWGERDGWLKDTTPQEAGYLLIYEKDQMDFHTAEQIHVNLLDNRYNNYVDEIPVTIPVQEPYQGLLDVLLYFLRPHITSESLDIYLNYLKEYHYETLKDDFATFLLAQTVIGLFWFWDHPSTAWRELSVQIQQQAKNGRLPHMLRAQQKRLELQYKMLYESSMTEEKECMEMDDPVLAKGWMHIFQADWKKVEADIPLMIACAEKNPELFGSVQGYQNMTYPILE